MNQISGNTNWIALPGVTGYNYWTSAVNGDYAVLMRYPGLEGDEPADPMLKVWSPKFYPK